MKENYCKNRSEIIVMAYSYYMNNIYPALFQRVSILRIDFCVINAMTTYSIYISHIEEYGQMNEV